MKRKINIDRARISKEEIAQNKNFNQLMNLATPLNLPFYKSAWFGPSIASVIIITISIITYIQLNQNDINTGKSVTLINQNDTIPKIESQQITYEEDTPCIVPPSDNLQQKATSFLVNNQKGKRIEHSSGTIIEIPKNAFVLDGKPVKGNVNISYKEYKDQVDILLSGIPMHYDSANTDYVLESAGMIQIFGYQNDIPVEIAENKTIKISFPTEDLSKRFNLYELDTSNKQWNYKGKPSLIKETIVEDDNPVTVYNEPVESDNIIDETIDIIKIEKDYTFSKNKIQSDLDIVIKEIKVLEDNMPVQPKESKNKDRQFNLEVEAEDFPELNQYEKVLFEVVDNQENFNLDLYFIDWDNVILEEFKKGEIYKMILYKNTEATSLLVKPVFDGVNIKEAMKKFESYTQILKEKQKEEVELKEKYEQAYKKYKDEIERIEQENKLREELAKNMREQSNFKKSLLMSFEIDRLGTWNCDSPVTQPKGKTVTAKFSSIAGTSLILGTVYLIERKRNAIFPYDHSQFNKLKFNPKEDNILVGFTSDNQIAIFSTEKFKEVREKEHEFKMEMKNALNMTVKNLKKLILQQ